VPDADIAITAGAGTPIRAFQRGAGDFDQYVRAAFGTAKGNLTGIPWTVTTAGLASVIAADVTRVGLIVVSGANGIVYVRFDSTIPTSAAYDYLLNPGDRWEVPHEFAQLAQSWAGAVAGGSVFAAAATCA
jgi:hypothetical protein